MSIKELRVLIRGAGDVASGVAHRLFSSNIKKILMLDVERPTAVRREVSFCEAIYQGEKVVEGVKAVKVSSLEEVEEAWKKNFIAVMVDPECRSLDRFQPDVLIDAIMAKRNLGTKKDMASLVIGLGPGFTAGMDVDAVIETKRGHNLGKVIWEGSAEPDTGIPGPVMGYTEERVIRAPCKGIFKPVKKIGDMVSEGDLIAFVDETPVKARISGVIRGLLREGLSVTEGFKCGDIDPRGIKEYCYTISDKARAIGGGVLEAILGFFLR